MCVFSLLLVGCGSPSEAPAPAPATSAPASTAAACPDVADHVRQADANGSCSVDTPEEVAAYVSLEKDCAMLAMDLTGQPAVIVDAVKKRREELRCK